MRGEVREISGLKRTWWAIADWQLEESKWEGMQGSIQKSRMASSWQPARIKELQIYNHRSWIFTRIWVSLEVDASPQLPQKSPVWPKLWFQHCETLSMQPIEPTRTSDLQICEWINGFCFMPLSLWQSVLQLWNMNSRHIQNSLQGNVQGTHISL